MGISRKLAAFHLDKLVVAGLLKAGYANLSGVRRVGRLPKVYEPYGFEPARDAPTLLRLRNCPFHPLAAKAPDLVCAINHAFLTGLLDGLDAGTVHATLAPRPGACCVELTGPLSS